MYNPAITTLNIDSTWTDIVAALPEAIYGLIAIAIYNILVSDIPRLQTHALMTDAWARAWESISASEFLVCDQPKTELAANSVVTLGVLMLRVPSLVWWLGFSPAGPLDGKTCFLFLFGFSFSYSSGLIHKYRVMDVVLAAPLR